MDIGATVSRQYAQLGAWADLVTAAPVLGGAGVVKGLPSGGVVLVAEMSSQGALRSAQYTRDCLDMAADMPLKVLGFVCQSDLTPDPG